MIPYVESFNGKLEGELLGGELSTSLQEARVVIEQYRVEYNLERPHSALGYQTRCGGCRGEKPAAPEFSTRCCGELHQGALLTACGKLTHLGTPMRPGTENGVLTNRR
jgi:hypothetical protein